ncbi:hypothetical protein [Candidatus Enterococcus mansonii]|uniref:J domain-containing protein n=1 Tax=Candidatus Enterococcus mansonii TaxID=1834181 RepID=A0A242CIR6_9ENTE|nr:hypothetical protein [Enterococcus sp. 4G2_DIV0659]OTO10134.1 hypothetical protein A5880_000817 [Enterococcus sp. 4G2_DIV0659]
MNCWEILSLEPTSNKEKIKEAYELKRANVNEESDPVAAHNLKEAFESAIFLSGAIIDSSRPTPPSSLSSIKKADETKERSSQHESVLKSEQIEAEIRETNDEELKIESIEHSLKNEEALQENQPLQIQKSDYVNVFKKELTSLFESMTFFANVDQWAALFLTKSDWSKEEYSEISEVMQQFLKLNYRVLSKTVIDYLGTLFEFDTFVKHTETGESFSYTWLTIKQVPLFSFDIYQNISKENRLNYFMNRYELFQLFKNGLPDQSLWEERLHSCRSLTDKDIEVINLQIAYQLMSDFRVENEQTINGFKHLCDEAKAIENNETTDFFIAYYEWLKNEGSANAVLIYDKSNAAIPKTAIDLLMGNVYFHLRRHSRVKECWTVLAQKNPSLFHRDELAMLRSARDTTVTEKKKKGVGHYLWLGFLLLLFILKVGRACSDHREESYYDFTTESESISSEEQGAVGDSYTEDLTELKESENRYDQFIYYFYIDRKDEDREKFIEENLVGHAKEMAKTVNISELPEILIDSRYDFYASPDNVAEYGPVTALTLVEEDNPFVILQEDDEEKISRIFGEGWEELSQEKFEALWKDIQVRPMMSQKFFVVYYLLSDDREENLKDNPEYVTENVKKMLEKNRLLPKAEEFQAGTWQISQDAEDKLYTIINDDSDEHRLILSYDEYGRLEHIYGEKWEKLDANKQKIIYEKAEEKIGVY